jgi:short-subunit dehydrogenase
LNIVITGASSGIGAVLAERLGSAGHRVALAARREVELQEVARRAGAGALVVPTDVTRRADVERLRDRAIEAFGYVDVWVNNAGRGMTKAALELTDDDLDAMITANVKSALYGMQAIVPHFKERGRGHVINISSMLSRVPFASYRAAYSAAKAALNSLTANVRMDLAATHPGIHVSIVIPGLVTTSFGENAAGGSPPIPAAAMADAQTPEVVAEAIAGLIDRPVAEVYTNPNHRAMAVRYFEDVGAFERNIARGRPQSSAHRD